MPPQDGLTLGYIENVLVRLTAHMYGEVVEHRQYVAVLMRMQTKLWWEPAAAIIELHSRTQLSLAFLCRTSERPSG